MCTTPNLGRNTSLLPKTFQRGTFSTLRLLLGNCVTLPKRTCAVILQSNPRVRCTYDTIPTCCKSQLPHLIHTSTSTRTLAGISAPGTRLAWQVPTKPPSSLTSVPPSFNNNNNTTSNPLPLIFIPSVPQYHNVPYELSWQLRSFLVLLLPCHLPFIILPSIVRDSEANNVRNLYRTLELLHFILTIDLVSPLTAFELNTPLTQQIFKHPHLRTIRSSRNLRLPPLSPLPPLLASPAATDNKVDYSEYIVFDQHGSFNHGSSF